MNTTILSCCQHYKVAIMQPGDAITNLAMLMGIMNTHEDADMLFDTLSNLDLNLPHINIIEHDPEDLTTETTIFDEEFTERFATINEAECIELFLSIRDALNNNKNSVAIFDQLDTVNCTWMVSFCHRDLT